MTISLQNAGKRYNREWIFRRFNYNFIQGNSYAITGNNGSGKSTLLQVIAGAVLQSEGIVEYRNDKPTGNNEIIAGEKAYRRLSIAAPYLELIEELTAKELLRFHEVFKPLKTSHSEILSAVGLQTSAEKQIQYFSSGMKQRLKLGLAFFSHTSVLMLDEPTTNLDAEGIALYKRLWKEHTADRLVIVSSNDKTEYEGCQEIIALENYK